MSDSTSSNKSSMTDNCNNCEKYVKLNVGNHLFLTSFDTLTKEDTMFKAMFSGHMEVVQDSEGKAVID
jgi:BTB/POZ domain-containing adapter for CUL3-mediated RhoA degradation protein